MINHLDIPFPNDSNVDLSGLSQLLKDLLKALLSGKGGKKIIDKFVPALDEMKKSNPNDKGLTDLINALEKMLDALLNGKKGDFNWDDFLKLLKQLIDWMHTHSKGTVLLFCRI